MQYLTEKKMKGTSKLGTGIIGRLNQVLFIEINSQLVD